MVRTCVDVDHRRAVQAGVGRVEDDVAGGVRQPEVRRHGGDDDGAAAGTG